MSFSANGIDQARTASDYMRRRLENNSRGGFGVEWPRGRAVPGPGEKGTQVIKLLAAVLRIYTFVLIAHAVFSWLPPQHRDNEVYRFIDALTEPVLRPLRRILPPLSGLDLSVMVAIIAAHLLSSFLLGLGR